MRRRLSVLAFAASLTLAPATLRSAHARAHEAEARPPQKKAVAGKAKAKPAPPKDRPPVRMCHLTTHETFLLQPDHDGKLPQKRLRGLRHFLRCHHTGREHAMAPRLAQLLYTTSHHFGDRPITVIAGYRAPKIAREKGNPKSPHKKGLACDFRVEGVSNTQLRDYLRSAYSNVGVGYYPNAGFCHLDVGRKSTAFWIDYSSPGQRAEYSRDAEGDLRSGRADAPRPRITSFDESPTENTFDDDPGLEDLAHPKAPPTAP